MKRQSSQKPTGYMHNHKYFSTTSNKKNDQCLLYKSVNIQMIDKLKKQLNNSASLGKTLARTQQPLHYSYFAEPKEFDMHSIKDSKESFMKAAKREIQQTPKLSSAKIAIKNIGVCDSLAKIKQSRNKCAKIGQDIHASVMDKSMRLGKMFKDMHHFTVCVDELKWLLNEGNSLINAYLTQALLIAPDSAHTLDVSNICQQFKSLVLRFSLIQKNKMNSIEEFLRFSKIENLFTTENFDDVKFNQELKLATFPQGSSLILSKQRQKDSKNSQNNSILQTRHFSMPLKENVNSSNLTTHFENIKIVKPQKNKDRSSNKGGKQAIITTNSQSIREKDEYLQQQKQQLYKKLRTQYQKNEQLIGKNEMLLEEISLLQNKMTTYKVASFKSIEKLSEVLKRLMINLPQQQKEFQLLNMAQCLNNWQKMMQQDIQSVKYKELYGNPQTMQVQRTSKMQQIIELQYEINSLLGQKKHLQNRQTFEIEKRMEKQQCSQDLYRMLTVQACTLQELCSL